MPAVAPPPSSSVTWRLPAVALAVGVLPGALERLGLAPDDEAVRIPWALATLAVALLAGAHARAREARRAATGPTAATDPGVARGPSLATLVALGCAAAVALLPLRATTPRPTVLSLGFLGPGAVALATFAAIALGAASGGDPATRRRVFASFGVVAVVAAAWVLLDRLAGRPPVGPFGRTGVAGPAIAALGFAGHGALRDGRAGSLPRVLLTLVVVAGLVATGSRTGVAAAAAGAIVVALRIAPPRGRAVAGVLALAGVVGAGLLATGATLPGVARATVDVRLGLLRASARLVAERPLDGHGAFGFPAQVLRVRDLEEARLSRGARPLAAHADVAHAAVEGGLGAGLAVVGLLGLALGTAWRRARPRAGGDAAAPDATAVGALGLVTTVAVAAFAEDPLLSMTTAPWFGWVVGALGARSGAGHARPGGRPGLAYLAPGIVAAVLLSAVVDHVHALTVAGTPAALERGAFLASEGQRARGYDAAAAAARAGDFATARERYARLLAWDPGATEARLDVAETFRLEGRRDDARATLVEAARLDPTRFDVPHRRGHLALGDEAPPSRRAPPAGALEALKAYNEAAALAPGRFETQVAYARVHRRRGDLASADHALEAAATAAERDGMGVPAEVLVETFRLAEAVGAPLADAAKALALALRAGPRVAGEMRAEADAALDAAAEADRAAAAARAREGETEAKRLEALGKADRDAAAVRLAGLVRSGLLAPSALRADAQRAATARDGRRAVTLYRALLSDPYGVRDVSLVLEARAAAAGVDAARADEWAALGRTMLGIEALGRGDAAAAAREFEAALARDGADALALFGFARALVALDRRDEAARALERAVKADPAAWDAAAGSADLGPLLPPRRP